MEIKTREPSYYKSENLAHGLKCLKDANIKDKIFGQRPSLVPAGRIKRENYSITELYEEQPLQQPLFIEEEMNFTKMSKIILNSEANYNKMMEDVTRVVVKNNELHTIDVRETHNN